MYILLAIVLLGVLITVHEFGHFAAARLCGIPVKEYSIGFGPKLVQWKSKKHETVFSIRPIPLGGYCMFFGDTDDDPNGEKKDDPRNYNNAPVWKRMISVAAGPLMNMVLAFVVAIGLMAAYGVTIATPFVASVTEGSPAAESGLEAGDVFVSVGGQDMTGRTVTDVSDAIGSLGAGSAIDITVLRDGQEETLTITPRYDEAEERWLIGIMIQQGYAIQSACCRAFDTGNMAVGFSAWTPQQPSYRRWASSSPPARASMRPAVRWVWCSWWPSRPSRAAWKSSCT